MTYVATSLSGSNQTTSTAAPRMARTRPVSDQPMIAANPALNRVNGGLRVGGNNKALLAGVGVAALLVLGGGTWYLTQHSATTKQPAPVAAPVSALATAPAANTPAQPTKADVVASPATSQPVSSDRPVTSSSSATQAKPVPIRSLRTPADRVGPTAMQATPATGGLTANLAPQPQAVAPPVISPAPEAVEPVAPVTSEAAPAPTTIQPAQPTVTPPSTTPAAADAPSAPQPQA